MHPDPPAPSLAAVPEPFSDRSHDLAPEPSPDEGTGLPAPVRCSAKACHRDAEFLVVWNNPRVHTPDREKTWAACEQHRDSLAQHLDVRGFLLRVEPLRATCPQCGGRFPVSQQACPVCADVRTGSCDSRD